MLRISGEFAVDTELDNHPDVVTCRAILDDRRKEEQSAGWWYNTIVSKTLFRDSNGKIAVPVGTLSLDADNISTNVSIRGSYLYDNDNDTFKFDSDIVVTMVLDVPEDEIPPIALAVIKWKAVLEYAGDEQVTGTVVQSAQASLAEAERRLVAERYRKTDTNFNNNPMSRRLFAFRNKFTTQRRYGYNGSAGVNSKLRKY